MDYLPNNATIDEACEWLQHKTGQKWTLPRLLEDGHLTPYVWSDYKEGYPQVYGNSREGYLTKMVYHGDVMRLAADRNDALLTMFTAHDGTLVKTDPAWRVELKDIRFKRDRVERVAEIINKQKTAPATDTATPVPVPVETVEQRRTRYLAWHTEEHRINPRGALQRVYEREAKQNPKADRANIGKDIEKARGTAKTQKQVGGMFGQLVQVRDGKRQN